MKICMVVYSFYEVDTRVMQYANALARRGDSVDVLSIGRPGQPKHEAFDRVRVYRLQTREVNERGPFSYMWRLLRFLVVSGAVLTWRHLFRRYTLIHVHNLPNFLVFSALVPKLFGTPVILDIHDLQPEMYADKFDVPQTSLIFRTLTFTERVAIGFSTHTIIANHIWYERLLSRSARLGRLTTIRNYPDPRIFHSYPRQARNGTFLIVYPGSLNWYQGVDVAIRAFARVADKMPNAQFHIYGAGPSKPDLIDLVAKLRLSDRILFPNSVPATQIARVMSSADLAIEPKQARSRFANEAASTKILEFMAVGVPLIVSRTSVHSYYFDESMVRFFTPGDDVELAESILEMHRRPELRAELVNNAQKHVEAHNWGVRQHEYLALVDQLAKVKHLEDTSAVDAPERQPSKPRNASEAPVARS
ncbi:MAG: glycosyltransferase family 4 protein [Candidatus Acidiferrales bacterium]